MKLDSVWDYIACEFHVMFCSYQLAFSLSYTRLILSVAILPDVHVG